MYHSNHQTIFFCLVSVQQAESDNADLVASEEYSTAIALLDEAQQILSQHAF